MAETPTPKRRGAGYQPPKERAKYIIGGAVALLCVGIIGGAVVVSNAEKSSTTAATQVEANPSAAAPKVAQPSDSETPFAIKYSDVVGVAPKAGAPTVTLWEDFQCPGCAALEDAIGTEITGLAKTGDINLILRPTVFLDQNLKNDASSRATAAWGIALDAGYGDKFRELLFVNHPTTEGDGWTNQQLVDIARQAGATEEQATALEKALVDGTYREWAANSTQQFFDLEIQGTPYVEVDGKPVTDVRTLISGEGSLLDRLKAVTQQ